MIIFKQALNKFRQDVSECARRKYDFRLASKSVTQVTDFGERSLCCKQSLIKSEIA